MLESRAVLYSVYVLVRFTQNCTCHKQREDNSKDERFPLHFRIRRKTNGKLKKYLSKMKNEK